MKKNTRKRPKQPLANKASSTLHPNRNHEAITAMVHGLDLFIAQANSADLGTAARILHQAKEDIVLWAVTMGFHETAEDKYINRHLYNNCLFAASDFIARLLAMQNDEKFSGVLKEAEKEQSPFTLMEALRKAV